MIVASSNSDKSETKQCVSRIGTPSGDPQALRNDRRLFSLIGIGALIAAFYQYSEVQHFLNNGVKADATVVD